MDLQQVLSSLEKADAAGDTQAAQALADLARSLMGGQQPVQPTQTKPTNSALSAGFQSYAPALQEAYGGLKTLTGVASERMLGAGDVSKSLIESGATSIKEAKAKQEPFATPERTSFSDALDKGIGSVLTEWLPYQVGSGAANILESLAITGAGAVLGSAVPGIGTVAGGATGLLAKEVAKRGIKEAAEKILAQQGEKAATDFFLDQTKKAAVDVSKKIASTTGIAGMAGIRGAGEVTGRAVEEAEKAGGTASDIELARVAPAAAVHAVAEFVSDKIGLGALDGLGKEGKSYLYNIGKNILVTGTKESPTEIVQSMAERYGAKLSLTDATALKEYIDSVAASYAMSTAPGTVGGVRQTMAARAAPEVTPEAPSKVTTVTPPEQPAYKPVPSLTGTDAATLLEEQAKGTAGTDLLAGAREREPNLYQPAPSVTGGDMASMLQGAPTAGADLVSASKERQAEQDRIQQEQKAQAEQQQASAQERTRQMPGMVGTDTTGTQLVQLQREKQKLEEAAANKAKEIEYRKILATTYSADPLQNFRQQQAAIDRLDYTTPEVKAQEPAMTEKLLALQREDEKQTYPKILIDTTADKVAPVTKPVANETKAPEAVPPVVEDKKPGTPTERQEAIAFGKAIGAKQPYPGSLSGRVNLPAQKAAKEGSFQGVLSALEKSKNVIVAEIARRAKSLGTKIVIDDQAKETYARENPLMRQMSIDGAKMHLEALNKIRELASQVDALPDGSRLGYDITDQKINAFDKGEDAGQISLSRIADNGHSMFSPLPTGPVKLRTKEDFKALQKAFEDITNEVGEDALQMTSTGSAKSMGVAGAYDSAADTIRVPEYFAKDEQVLAHEIVHAQVLKIIASPSLRGKPIVIRLNKLYQHVKAQLEEKAKQDKNYRKPYALESIQEFVAEGMGNPSFQLELKRIKYENTSAWDSFVQTIANLIGVKRDTAFTELLSVYSELTTEATPVAATKTTPIEEGPMPKSIDQIEAETRAEEQVGPIQKYVADLTDKKKKPLNLWNVLRGRLTKSEVSDISPDLKYIALRQPASKGGGTDLSTLVQNGDLDEFLPPAMRMSMQDQNEIIDETDAVKYIKEKLRSGGEDYYTYDTQVALKEAFGSIEEAENAVNEFLRIEDANELLAEAAEEQRAIDKEAEIITPEGEDRTATESAEEGLTAPTPEELKAADERAKAEEKRIADEKKAADDKDKADSEVGEFILTGSDRVADADVNQGDFFSLEPKSPYSDLAKRNPSFKRKVDKLNRDLDSGKIELGEFANQVKWAADEADRAREATEPKPRERGADYIRQRLLEAKRRGDLSEEAVDFAEWFIQRNPQLLDDLGISIRKGSEEGVSGQYIALSRIMRLIKESSNDTTIVHEILHHMERMMPPDVQRAIRFTWLDTTSKLANKAIENKKENPKLAEYFEKLIAGSGAADNKSSSAILRQAVKMIQDGDVDYKYYQYLNPSEFWAVNGTRIMQGRFDAIRGGTLQKLKNWLKELGQKIKSLFGLPSDAPIIKAIDSLSKADGKFVSEKMLGDVADYFSITDKAKEKAQELLQKRKPAAVEKTTGGEAAMETLKRMGREVEPPADSYLKKTRQAWDNAVDNPKTTSQAVKDTLVRWSDQVQTWAFSSDAALNNNIRRSIMDSAKTDPEKTAFLLNTSLSQTVHADALASLFITEGNIRYNKELLKWEAVKDKDNLVSLVKGLEDIAKKYGLTQEQAQLIGHTAFEAKRLKSLVAFNQSVEQEVKDMRSEAAQLRKEGKSKAADSLYEKATKRSKETKFIHMTDEQIADGNALFKNIPELDNLVKTWNGIRTNATKVLIDTGLWSEADADFLLSNADYVPFFREDQLENGKGPKEFISGLQVQAVDRKLKGSNKPVNDIFDNMVRWTQYSINRGVRNRSAVALAEGAAEMGMARKVPVRAGNENVVRVWKNGEEVLYSMDDPMFIPAFTGLESIALPSWKILSKFANMLRQSVVMYPLFSVSQVPQDAFAAMFTSGLKPQYALRIPVLAVKEFVKTLVGKSKTHEELKMFGVTGVRDFTADMARVDAEVLAGLKAEPGILNAIKGKLHHIAMASDNAVRQATYEAAMAQGMSKSEALEKSFEIWNVRRKGSSQTLAIAGQVIPFFNAYLAAQNVAFNVITGKGTSPTKRNDAYKTLAATTASVMTLSLLYAMMNGDDEDYLDKPAAQRDRLLMIPGTGGMSIPLRKDLYTMPKIITEHVYLLMTDKGYEDGRKFRDSMKAALASALFSPTAVPQAIKPLVEVGINYDFFTGRPIIGQFQKKLEVERQFNDTTAELAKVFGSTGLVSPLNAEHLIRGMLGSVGGLVLYATNPILHSDPNVERPTLSAREMLATLPGTSGFISREDQTGLKNDFYVLRDEVAKVASTISDMKARSPEKLEDYLSSEDVIAKYGMSKAVNKMVEQLGKIRKQITQITNLPSDAMTGEEKQDQIKELKALEKDMLKSINVKELRAAANL